MDRLLIVLIYWFFVSLTGCSEGKKASSSDNRKSTIILDRFGYTFNLITESADGYKFERVNENSFF